jgi:hypothetical protein
VISNLADWVLEQIASPTEPVSSVDENGVSKVTDPVCRAIDHAQQILSYAVVSYLGDELPASPLAPLPGDDSEIQAQVRKLLEARTKLAEITKQFGTAEEQETEAEAEIARITGQESLKSDFNGLVSLDGKPYAVRMFRSAGVMKTVVEPLVQL